MRLTDEETAMLAGEFGEPRRWAIAHQIAVGDFFEPTDFVPVRHAHVMADTKSPGEAEVSFREGLTSAPQLPLIEMEAVAGFRGRAMRSWARATPAQSSCSTRQKAASPPPGCCAT